MMPSSKEFIEASMNQFLDKTARAARGKKPLLPRWMVIVIILGILSGALAMNLSDDNLWFYADMLFLALFLAFFVYLNILSRRDRKRMSPTELADHKEEIKIEARIW